jgi:hypothetical protein
MEKINKKKPVRRISVEHEALTREKFRPIFEDIKELVKSMAKGTETVLKKEIREVRDRVERNEHAIIENSRLIKALIVKIDCMR